MASKRSQLAMADSDSEGNDDWQPGDLDMRPPARDMGRHRGEPSRPRRAQEPTPETNKRPIRLNVKPPSRLRNVVVNEDDDESEASTPAPRALPSRLTKQNKPPIIEKPSESEDVDEDDEEEASPEESDDVEADQDEEEEASHEEAEASDVEMSEDATPAPPPPPPAAAKSKTKIKLNNPQTTNTARKPSPGRTLQKSKIQSVESKEISIGGTGADSDDELSPVASDASDDEDKPAIDAEGEAESSSAEISEEDAEDVENDAEGDEEDGIRAGQIDSDDLGSSGDEMDSRGGTPDPAKLTRRQRATSPSGLLALSNEAQKKKFFTAEQITMRRTEMARRRKDLSEKRNEQEKLDTLDRLLHKRAPVRRSRKEIEDERMREEFGTPGGEGSDGSGGYPRPKAGFVRTVMSAKGTRVGVPREWDGRKVGRVFEGVKPVDGGLKVVGGTRMVQVVE